MERLDLTGSRGNELLEERIFPEIRKYFFPDLSVDSFLETTMMRCRAAGRPDLYGIWHELDALPFDCDEYSEVVERLESELKTLPHPPSAEDWDDLEEWLMK
jgi:hypothetical protein